MKTHAELEEMFGITPERVAEIDKDANKGVLQGHATKTVTGPYRFPLPEEDITSPE